MCTTCHSNTEYPFSIETVEVRHHYVCVVSGGECSIKATLPSVAGGGTREARAHASDSREARSYWSCQRCCLESYDIYRSIEHASAASAMSIATQPPLPCLLDRDSRFAGAIIPVILRRSTSKLRYKPDIHSTAYGPRYTAVLLKSACHVVVQGPPHLWRARAAAGPYTTFGVT
jgi:hypothetical protein